MKNKKYLMALACGLALCAVACSSDSGSGTSAGEGHSNSCSSQGAGDMFDFNCYIYQKSSCDFKITDAKWEISIAKYGYCSNITGGVADTIWETRVYTPNDTGYTHLFYNSNTGHVFENNCRNSTEGVVYQNDSDTLKVVRTCEPTRYTGEMLRISKYAEVGKTLESLYAEALKECEAANTDEDW